MEQIMNVDNTADITVLNINEKYTVDNYPTGKGTVKATLSIEFNKDHGFKPVIEIADPVTVKRKKPRSLDYAVFMYMYQEKATGKIKFARCKCDGLADINTIAQVIAQHFTALQLTPIMIEDLYLRLFAWTRAFCNYLRVEPEELFKVIEPSVNALVHGAKTGENVFGQVNIDMDTIKQLQKEFREKEEQQGLVKRRIITPGSPSTDPFNI